jgi:isopenicillin-N N-acyltransferase-like protein
MSTRRTPYRPLIWTGAVLGTVLVGIMLFRMAVEIKVPAVDASLASGLEREEVGTDMYRCGDNWLKKNEMGLWEMYISGSDYIMGAKNGILARELIHYQEEVFVAQLREMIPSDQYLRFLKQVVVWMNRKLDRNIPLEYQREIYGVSLQASSEFDFIGPAYQRMLNYHTAHDIGHALQNMNLVACTAMAVKDSRSADGKLLVGRNFDFSMGDAFAREKILAFFAPEHGYRFASVTWGGMIGVVSGMNEKGLVVTLNAAKSGIPSSARTPTSILARQILQYASTIDEALAIAGQWETFVSESFLISSARDRKTVVIEKSPKEMDVYDAGGDVLILTNHFQGETFRESELTLRNKAEGASVYRWERTAELLRKDSLHDPHSFAAILRDRNGRGDLPIGLGNEKAVNQLVAHHSVIFRPEDRKMWVSARPYQLGSYLCYDLDRVFADSTRVFDEIRSGEESIAEDPFLHSEEYADFELYRKESARLKKMIEAEDPSGATAGSLDNYLELNPDYYYPYFLAGEVWRLKGEGERAEEMYRESLAREIPRVVDREQVQEALEKVEK